MLGPEGNPHYFTSNSTFIPVDSTLLVLPGTEFQFSYFDSLRIFGELIAEGTQEDSIIFKSLDGYPPSKVKIFFKQFSSDNTSLSYCTFHTLNDFYIEGPDISVKNCRMSYMDILNGSSAVLDSCELTSMDIEESNATIANSYISYKVSMTDSYNLLINNSARFIHGYSSHDTIRNCYTELIYFSYTLPYGYNGYYTLTDNVIMGPINNAVDDTLYLENNIIDLTNSLATYETAISECRVVYAYNNTIISREYGIWADYVFASNNIIYADYGIASSATYEDTIKYNLFWDCIAPIFAGSILGAGNIVNGDPLLRGGNPFDYSLQPNSACIDAGDPDFPLDPDLTWADIGAIYYDQTSDNPPVLLADTLVNAFPNISYSQEFIGVDDGNSVTFEFDDLPEWVSVIEPEYTSDSLYISGIVPADQESFIFTALVFDELLQADSQQIRVRVCPNPLQGSLSGTLSGTVGEYTVIDDISLEEGNTLIIEPGVTLKFNRRFEETPVSFWVSGRLICEGTEEDSIRFISAEPDPMNIDWLMGSLFNPQCSFSYCNFADFEYIGLTTRNMNINNCSFTNSENALFVGSIGELDTITVEDCSFSEMFTGIWTNTDGNYSIINCNFQDIGVGIFFTGNTDLFYVGMKNNVFDNAVVAVDGSECGYFYASGNTVLNCVYGINVSNCQYDISHNLFDFCGSAMQLDHNSNWTEYDTLLISNNTINRCNYGIKINDQSATPSDTVTVSNNIVTNSQQMGIYTYDQPLVSFLYNDVWNNNPDYSNLTPGEFDISLDPEFLGIPPYEYHLTPASPCIDAGDPNSPPDPDGSRADMGAFYFDHANNAPEIIAYFPENLDSTTVLNQVEFSVQAVDLDQDELYYYWYVNDILQSEDSVFTFDFPELGADTVEVMVSDLLQNDQHIWVVEVVPGSGAGSRDNIVYSYYLEQNYPNPCNPSTNIKFGVKKPSLVSLKMYNSLGQEAAVISEQYRPAGEYNLHWPGLPEISSGIYFVRMSCKSEGKTEYTQLIKLVYLK